MIFLSLFGRPFDPSSDPADAPPSSSDKFEISLRILRPAAEVIFSDGSCSGCF
jgi:hypothetical protein